jgi:hypothetical protein
LIVLALLNTICILFFSSVAGTQNKKSSKETLSFGNETRFYSKRGEANYIQNVIHLNQEAAPRSPSIGFDPGMSKRYADECLVGEEGRRILPISNVPWLSPDAHNSLNDMSGHPSKCRFPRGADSQNGNLPDQAQIPASGATAAPPTTKAP